MKNLLIVVFTVLFFITVSSKNPTNSKSISLDPDTWTHIGPAPVVNGFTDYDQDASGRITALAADPRDPDTIYIAAAGGGVWKTRDGGTSWIPLTDMQNTLFMGAIALAPSDPETIYAGTGEAHMGPSKARNFRDNVYYGRGVLKSPDGGTTWTLLGNAEFDRRTISRIVVDSVDPQTVYVAVGALATNGLLLPGKTGIWKSTDGGASWRNTTEGRISTVTAFSDLVIDPSNSQVLYAAVGEPGVDPDRPRADNGVWKTLNGGESWARAGNFPTGANSQVGRIALAISRSNSQILYASIARPGPPNSMYNSLYQIRKTINGGNNWLPPLDPGPICFENSDFHNYLSISGDYHQILAVDPADPNKVYAGGVCLIRSSDGGQTWAEIARGDTTGPHRDHHALDFDRAGKLLNGNDGGIWRLDDPEQLRWRNLNGNLEITQFVGAALHPIDPTIAYGGTQDTGSLKFEGSLRWLRLLRGDGGASAVSSSEPATVYQVTRIDVRSPNILRRSDNNGQGYAPKVTGIGASDRKNFYPPMVMDPSNSNRLLLGTNRVYETLDKAENWSGKSTPGKNGWTVDDNIDSIAPAPSDRNTIYATAGGHIFVSFDFSAKTPTWQQRDVAGIADHFRQLVVDGTNNLMAYAVRDRFGEGHVFGTLDGGQSWTDVSGDLPDLPTNTIVLDPRATPNVLYVGNDSGVFASTNLGTSWPRFKAGLPNVQVVDLKLNTQLNILAAATHGRGMWQILVPSP